LIDVQFLGDSLDYTMFDMNFNQSVGFCMRYLSKNSGTVTYYSRRSLWWIN